MLLCLGTRPATLSAGSPDIARLEAELSSRAGSEPYIVIDTSANRLTLRQGDSVLVQTSVATGSGKTLRSDDGRAWNFRTPRRTFTIRKKTRDPVWKKPEWAFVEKNETAPVLPWSFRRLDPSTLGAFALELEDSYAIHGTLYPTLLGRHITHGCVRVDEAPLQALYELAPVGTRVYVF